MVAGLLLAAGAGRRLGRPKALLRFRNRRLTGVLAEVLAQGGCDPVIVVLGASANVAAALIRDDLAAANLRHHFGAAVQLVYNSAWESGMGSSLVAGLRALPDTATAVAVTLVDKPGITAVAVRRLVAHAGPDALVAASYDGRRGHPVLFGRNHWADICASVSADSGAREYLRGHAVTLVECADAARDDDIDTPKAASAWGIE